MRTRKGWDKNQLASQRTLTGQLLESLGQAIVGGAFDDRGIPTEAEISKHYGVSRSSTREAVKMLTAKGILAVRPRSGISKRPQAEWSLLDPDVLRWMLERKFSLDLLRHFTEMRLGLEPAAAAFAAKNASAESLQAIEVQLGRMSAAESGKGDSLAADIAFHVSILNATENPFYMQLDELITTALKISIHMTNRIKGHTASVPAHTRVYDAIKAKDASRAAAAMRVILDEVMTLISAEQERNAGPPVTHTPKRQRGS